MPRPRKLKKLKTRIPGARRLNKGVEPVIKIEQSVSPLDAVKRYLMRVANLSAKEHIARKHGSILKAVSQGAISERKTILPAKRIIKKGN